MRAARCWTDSDRSLRLADERTGRHRRNHYGSQESTRGEAKMSRHDGLFALGGGVIGAVVTYGSIRLSTVPADVAPRGDIAAIGSAEHGGRDGDAGIDPAMTANENLTKSLHECSQSLARLMDDRVRLEQEIDGERSAEADASRAAQARRIARRNLSQDDWKQLAGAGTIRYVLPCASFDPTPEVVSRLGIAPQDIPAIQSALVAARDAAWAQIRPLCSNAAGGAVAADRLGLDSCPEVILDAEKMASPADADRAMRAVGAVKAGLAELSTIPPGDPVCAAFIVLTGVAKDAEIRLGSILGPEDARTVVYGSGNCSRVSEFTSSGQQTDR
jgi:hypothetical protein